MDFEALSEYLPRLETSLRHSYAEEKRRVAPVFRPYVGTLEGFTLRGGKRLRALLVLAGFHLATRSSPAPALPAAAALEHFQSWMLIHDDIIDHSEQRRGGPTVHRALAERMRKIGATGDPDELGVGLGITLGDLQEPFTIAALLRTKVAIERRLAAVEEFVRMTRETAYGQLLDIENGARPVDQVTDKMVLLVHELKSAIYTVASPLRIGAYLGGGSKALLSDLDSIGIDLGIAFQLRDDVLGTGFDAGAAGKSANDLIEGKRTLLVVRAWRKAHGTEREELRSVLGNPRASETMIARAREIIRTTGSLDDSEERIGRLHRRALARIERSRSIPRSARPLLGEIAGKLVHRKI
ncbi:MAG: polyprenyl synthetase family protein [Thermoplasmata archaeon]